MSLASLSARARDRVVYAICSGLLLCTISATAAESVATPSAAATSVGGILQVLLGLGLVLGAIAATAWLLRRFAPGQVAASGALRVVGGVAIGPKERVVVVDVGDTRLVLGVAPGRVNALHHMQRPAEEAFPAETLPITGQFYTRLKEAIRRKGDGDAAG